MAKKKKSGDELWQLTEKLLSKKSEGRLSVQVHDLKKLVHELQVFQTELELQNEELIRTQQDLEASRAKYLSLFDFAPIGYITFSNNGKILEINLTAANMLGRPRKTLLGRILSEFVAPEYRYAFVRYREGANKLTVPQHGEFKMIGKNGAPFYASMDSIAVPEHGIRCSFVDITERIRMEQELRKSRDELEIRVEERTDDLAISKKTLEAEIIERRVIQEKIERTNALLNLFSQRHARQEYLDGVSNLFHDWFGCRSVGIRILNEKGGIPYESCLGFTREFWKSENTISMQESPGCICVRVIEGAPNPEDLPMMTQNGSFRCDDMVKFSGKFSGEGRAGLRDFCLTSGIRSMAIIPIRYDQEPLGAIHLAGEKNGIVSPEMVEFVEALAPIIGEAVHRFNLEEALKESEERLRLLSSELLKAQEVERSRIAKEVHDSLGQSLASIKYRIEAIMLKIRENKGDQAEDHFKSLLPLIQLSIEEARRIQLDLHPPALDDLGILLTLSWFFRDFQTTYPEIRVKKKMEIEENRVPLLLKIVIYRIVQEAMHNVAKHSKATEAEISLRGNDSHIELTIRDNGRGFDLSSHHSEMYKKGLGLNSMQERANLSGGHFEIESSNGKGTTVRATWPLPETQDNNPARKQETGIPGNQDVRITEDQGTSESGKKRIKGSIAREKATMN